MRSHLNLPRLELTAAQFAGLGLLGNLIAVAVFLAPLPELRHLGLFFGFFLGMTPVLLSLGLYLWAINGLKNGVQNGLWTDDQLAPLRRITLSPFLTALSLLLMAAFLVLTLFNVARHTDHAHRAWGWVAYLFLMYMQQLQQATRRPTAKASAPRIDWRSSPPLESDHWGQR